VPVTGLIAPRVAGHYDPSEVVTDPAQKAGMLAATMD